METMETTTIMETNLPYSDSTLWPATDAINTTTNITEETGFVFDDINQRIIVATVVICTSILGICGNSLVILSVLLSRRLRTASNIFVMNLACSDLLTSLHTPWNAVALLSHNGWPLPAWICTSAAGIMFVCVGCSLYSLASIAVDRYIVITRLYRIDGSLYPRYVLVIWISLTWLIPFMVFIVPPLNGIGGIGYNSKYCSCSQLSTAYRSNTYDVITSTGLYPIPLIIIISCYLTVYCHIRRHTNNILNMSGRQDDDVTARVKNRQVQITKNMFYVVCGFFICITPYGVSLVIDSSDPVVPYAATLVLMNACINPLIYAKHPLFKKVYRKILTCRWKEVIHEESSSVVRMRTISSQRSPNYVSVKQKSSEIGLDR